MKRWHASIHYLVFYENPLESTATTTAGPGIPARAARPTSPASSPPSGAYMYAVADDEIALHLCGDSTARGVAAFRTRLALSFMYEA